MHAMVSIGILIECDAILTGILAVAMGSANIAFALVLGYAICAVVVSFGVAQSLANRGVLPQQVWTWRTVPSEESEPESWWRIAGLDRLQSLPPLLAGAGAGIVLGLCARGYLALLTHIPIAAELIRKSQEQMAVVPHLQESYAVTAIFFAPFAEEYLFRGLLFRALDREWGGGRAILGSAAFFAVYHPPLSWPPVFLLGAANAILFKRTGRLAPAVLLHMAYNAVVLT